MKMPTPDNTDAALADTLLHLVQWLQSCPTDRVLSTSLRQRFAQLRAALPAAQLELVMHAQPAVEQLDFDLLLHQKNAGTLSLSWQPETAQPWSVDYAAHWAANLVLTVDEADTNDTVGTDLSQFGVACAAESDGKPDQPLLDRRRAGAARLGGG